MQIVSRAWTVDDFKTWYDRCATIIFFLWCYWPQEVCDKLIYHRTIQTMHRATGFYYVCLCFPFGEDQLSQMAPR